MVGNRLLSIKPLINIGEGVIYSSICTGLSLQTYQKRKEVPCMVYVLDINGQPLMPTTRHGKVRRLLNSHLAKVVKRCPFTIQLLYQSTKEIQPVSLLYFDTKVVSKYKRDSACISWCRCRK